MRKVTTINLNGRAYQLEDTAFDNLQAYLKRAEKRLADDPDKAEVITDLEQAIADKCEGVLKAGKTVVSTEQIATILEQMGEVEGEDADKTEASATQASSEAGTSKKLYAIKEGAMFSGVCQGIAVYFGIDPTFVRIAFVILALITNGAWILVYVFLAVILPLAKTAAEKAEAYGKPVTAQDIVARAKERVPDQESIKRFSDVVVKICKLLFKIIGIAAVSVLGIITAGWVWVLWFVALGKFDLSGSLAFINGWRMWAAVSALYIVIALPLYAVYRIAERSSGSRPQTRAQTVSDSMLAAIWGIAATGLIAFVMAYGQNVYNHVTSNQGYLEVGSYRLCVDENTCGINGRFQTEQLEQ